MAVQYVKSVDIGKDRYQWLEDNPDFSFADLVRDAIDRKMQEEHESRCGTVE